MPTSLRSNLIDIFQREIYPVEISLENGKIIDIQRLATSQTTYILPAFVDAHIHIESSMLIPSQFARMAVVHGTVATVSDPHEIANVLGIEGVRYMIENGKKVPFKFNFGAPSCVPATSFETAGAIVSSEEVEILLKMPEIKYLSEMMNYPGILWGDKEVHKKIAIAKKYNKPIDGHAPALRGEQAKKYIDAGISTDHECFTLEEALEKLSYGMKIIIREGSAAKNFEALHPIIEKHWENVMFCSDDKHPDDLLVGHINLLVKRALQKGYDLFKVLQIACVNPVKHYNLEVGLLKKGDYADFIMIDNIQNFNVLKTYINGKLVADNGKTLIEPLEDKIVNAFGVSPKKVSDFALKTAKNASEIDVMVALNGEIVTQKMKAVLKAKNGNLVSDIEQDILKIAVINRYFDAPVSVAFIKNFGLKRGAIASSVAHDSHNIIAVGVSDEDICMVVNELIACKGGVAAFDGKQSKVLPLPVAGLMTTATAEETGKLYGEIDAMSKSLGSPLKAPFMTLSFMALLVIPSLKLSDKGLFDGEKFQFVRTDY
ncbi:MAG: adenine deaminase [Flammeovirgaceae bacterium]